MTTLLLLINYNSEEDTLRLLGDLQAQGRDGAWVAAVVDNTAHTRPAPALAETATRDPRIRYLMPGSNLGYFGGAAWGLDQLNGEEFDWVVVTNPDIRIPDPTFLARLARVEGAAVVGPRIVSGLSHRDQNPYLAERPSGRKMRMYRWIFASHLRLSAWELAARVKKSLQRGKAPATAPATRAIYAPHGSFIAFHRSYFISGGSLTHGTFLFSEETLVAETARRLGLTVRYEPSLEVLHAEHATTSVFTNRVVAGYAAAAAKWAADTYFANDP